MTEENTLSHLEALRADARDEVKRRIQQRDQYSMQLTVALGAIAVGAFSANGTPKFFALAPMVSIYFTALILYSYRIHDVLATYLRCEIEPQFQSLCSVPSSKELEIWYAAEGRRSGVRRWFFVLEMWVITLLSLAYVFHKTWNEPGFTCILKYAALTYFILAAWTSSWAQKKG
jgi:hypothetical protein